MYDVRQEGWVEAICGSMYAGKTEELIRRFKAFRLCAPFILLIQTSY